MPWWSIDFGDGTPTESDLEHIANLIKDGYQSGQYHGEDQDNVEE